MGHQGRRRGVPLPAAGLARGGRREHAAPNGSPTTRPSSDETLRLLHKTIAGVAEDYAALRNNTAAAKLIEYTNHLTKEDVTARAAVEPLVLMVAPLAPHLAEELWRRLGHDTSLAHGPFPQADPALPRRGHRRVPGAGQRQGARTRHRRGRRRCRRWWRPPRWPTRRWPRSWTAPRRRRSSWWLASSSTSSSRADDDLADVRVGRRVHGLGDDRGDGLRAEKLRRVVLATVVIDRISCIGVSMRPGCTDVTRRSVRRSAANRRTPAARTCSPSRTPARARR